MQNFNYTFIIPHHNSPKLLDYCLNSIPQREDVQIIVVDDNSQDDKKPKVSRSDVELYYIDADSTKGAGHARNIGIKHAKGKWVLFADCDDYYKEGFIDVLDQYMTADIDVLYFSFEYRDGITHIVLPDLHFKKYLSEFNDSKLLNDSVRFRHNVPWTKMVRLNFIKENDIIFEEVPNGNDIWFSIQVGYYAKEFKVDRREIYVYQRNENSILTSPRKSPSACVCKIIHIVQQNCFYNYINHPEWKQSAWTNILFLTKKNGLKVFFAIFFQSVNILIKRNSWVSNLKKRECKNPNYIN